VEQSGAQIRRARTAVSAGFYLFGLAFAMWAVHIPAITSRLSLDPAVLGAALLAVGLGGLVGQPLTGWLIARFGSRLASIVLVPLAMVTPLLPILAPNIPLLFVGTFLWGAVGGSANVAVNTQAAEVEAAMKKPIMSSFHGFFSLGQLTGAVLASPIYAFGLADGRGGAVVAVVCLIAALILIPHYINVPPKPAVPKVAGERRGLGYPLAAVFILSVLCFLCDMSEGAVGDWSALYLSTVRHLPEFIASSGYAAYALVMMVSRFAAGPVITRLGDQRVVLLGGISIALGIAVVVLSRWAWLSPIGFAILAAGAANNYPILISAGSRLPGIAAGTAVTWLATGGLMGFLIGPPIIGFVAHVMGLAAGVGSLILFGLAVSVGAALHRWPERPAAVAA